MGTYLPYPVRVCLNGHEWLKQQLGEEAIPFASLDNGFGWCADPVRLQQLADALGAADVQAFFDRWLERLPWPLTSADRAAGYHHRLSIWQLEMISAGRDGRISTGSSEVWRQTMLRPVGQCRSSNTPLVS